MNETTKYGLFFLGGVVLGALGAVAVTRGKLDVKPLATDLLSAGIDLKEKALSAVESAKEDIADAVAEAQVKSQEKKARAEEIRRLQPSCPRPWRLRPLRRRPDSIGMRTCFSILYMRSATASAGVRRRLFRTPPRR